MYRQKKGSHKTEKHGMKRQIGVGQTSRPAIKVAVRLVMLGPADSCRVSMVAHGVKDVWGATVVEVNKRESVRLSCGW